jgi:tripartite ATP-independent transporter DctM subunit
LAFCVYIGILVAIKPQYAPAITDEEQIKGVWEKIKLGKFLIAPVLIIGSVLGAILAGVASPTEASGVGVFAVIILLLFRKKLSVKVVQESLISTISATGMAMWIAFASTCFVGAYAMGGGQEFANSLLTGLPGGRWGALIFTQFVYVILGMFIDWIGICLLIVPIFTPVLVSMGFDPVWVGIMFMVNMQLSFLSPPFGYALFFVKGIVSSDVSMGDIWLGAMPFLLIQILVLIICGAVPGIILLLPGMLH